MALSSIAMCSRVLFPSPKAMASPPALPPEPLHRPTSLPASMSPSPLQIVHPSLQFANLLWFKGTFNAQVFVGENEAPDSIVRRFRRAVMQAGVISECRRRRFFETPQDIKKRKRQASQKKRSRRFGPRPDGFEKKEAPKAVDDDDGDNWEYDMD